MGVFVFLMIIGIISITLSRSISRNIERELATITCIRHSWDWDKEGHLYCTACGKKPE